MRLWYWIILAVIIALICYQCSPRARTDRPAPKVDDAVARLPIQIELPVPPIPIQIPPGPYPALGPDAPPSGEAYDPSETAAWIAGYRPAQGLPFESAMTVSVVGPNGSLADEPIEVEFVFAFLLPEERLNGVVMSGGGKDEADGTRWISRYGRTDAMGIARIEDLPYVQCKVTVGGKTVVAYPATNLRFEVEPLDEDLFYPRDK